MFCVLVKTKKIQNTDTGVTQLADVSPCCSPRKSFRVFFTGRMP